MNNFIKRTLSGVVFLGIMLGGLLWSPIPYCVVFSFIILVMMKEYLDITLGHTHKIGKYFALATGFLLFLFSFASVGYGLPYNYFLILVLPVMLILISLLYSKDKESYKTYPYLFTSVLYIALPFSLCNLIAFDATGAFNGYLILALMIILWCSDVGAYLFGMTLGQKNGHKLFPSISPKKSWEGYIGSVFTSILAGFLLNRIGWFPFSIIHSVIISVLINIFATFGDLIESQLKRQYGVKDSGNIMPGHGGLLDRFDGAIVAFPIAIAYIYIFGLI